jgi:hypothetical protein
MTKTVRPLATRLRPASMALALGIVLLPAVVGTKSAEAQTEARSFKVLYNFKGAPDGNNPVAGLIRDAAGNLYGTTVGGGGSTNCASAYLGCGTVFMLGKTGKETVLYSFTGSPDGANPRGCLVRDARGNLLWHYLLRRRPRRRNGVQSGGERYGDGAAQLRWHGRRRSVRGWFDPGRGGQTVRHHCQRRRLHLGNGVQSGCERRGGGALQLPGV